MASNNGLDSSSPGGTDTVSSKPDTIPPSGHPFRSRYRAASHQSAHDAPAATDSVQLDHVLVPKSTEPLITTQPALAKLLDVLRSTGTFAYDSEFIGESSYHPQLCLIQIATTQNVWLIDPMSGVDLTPFWELLADPSVEKLVHAGEQDLEPVVRHLGKPALNVFDTQIAAGFVAMNYPCSLSKLVLEMTGVKLGKGLTFTDWSQRPLSGVQLRYAADDVRYLPMIVDTIRRRLNELGHAKWARVESESMGEPARFLFDPDADYLRVRGAGGLPPQNLAVLRELTGWRDGAAQRNDAPPRGYLKDDILIALARSPVKSAQQFSRIRGLPRPVEVDEGAAIIAATARGLAADVDRLAPKPPEPSPTQKFAADALWAALQTLAAGRSIDPALISSRQEIGDLHRLLLSGGDYSQLRLMRTWRRDAVGNDLIDLYLGRSRFALGWTNGLSSVKSS